MKPKLKLIHGKWCCWMRVDMMRWMKMESPYRRYDAPMPTVGHGSTAESAYWNWKLLLRMGELA